MKRTTVLSEIIKFVGGNSGIKDQLKRDEFLQTLNKYVEYQKKRYKIKQNYKIDNKTKKKIKKTRRKKKTQEFDFSKRMDKQRYKNYLQSDIWRKIKAKVFSIKGKKCEKYGTTMLTEVYHSVYENKILKGKSLKGLRVVCRDCHTKIHNLEKDTGYGLLSATIKTIGIDKDYLAGTSVKTRKKAGYSLKKLGTIEYFRRKRLLNQ